MANRLLDKTEGVDVLDLRPRAQGVGTQWPQRDVDIATHRAFGHVAVGNTQVSDQAVQGFQVGYRLGGVAQVGFGHDFQQRGARPVEVDASLAVKILVQRLARIFFQVGTGDTYGAGSAVLELDLKAAATDDGSLELADLVALGQVRVKIILAVEHRAPANVRANTEPEHDGVAHRQGVQYRQHAGHGQVDGTGLGVGLGAKCGGRTGKYL